MSLSRLQQTSSHATRTSVANLTQAIDAASVAENVDTFSNWATSARFVSMRTTTVELASGWILCARRTTSRLLVVPALEFSFSRSLKIHRSNKSNKAEAEQTARRKTNQDDFQTSSVLIGPLFLFPHCEDIFGSVQRIPWRGVWHGRHDESGTWFPEQHCLILCVNKPD